MTDKIYDATNPLPVAGANARLELAADDTVLIDLSVYGGSGIAVQGNGTKFIDIGANGSIRGGSTTKLPNEPEIVKAAIELITSGAGTTAAPNYYNVYNDGSISSSTGYGIKIVESTGSTGALNLLNSGTINTGSIAISGGTEGDFIVNTGTIRTTGATLMDLGKGNDFYDGTQGSAYGRIVLGEGNDTALGGSGSEIFSGGAGDDSMDGGAGVDTVDYSVGASSGVYVELSKTTWQAVGGGHGQDLLINIENLIGTDFGDTLIGNAGNDKLSGREGNDTLDGGANDDTLEGGDGNDMLIGGAGSDTAVFTKNRAEYDFMVPTNWTDDTEFTVTHLNGGADGVDTLKSIRLLKFLDKTIALTNTAVSDAALSGTGVKENAGNDDFVGTLSGTDADGDSLTFTLIDSADGRFKLGSDGRTIQVADKTKLDYETATQHTIKVKVTDGLILNGATDPVYLEKEIIVKVQNAAENISVTRNGGTGNDVLTGELGNDTMSGAAGNDNLSGDLGNDSIDGGIGNDILNGGDGNDTLKGGDNEDTIIGGKGDDWIYCGKGVDSLTGGEGKDIFVFDTRPTTTNYDVVTDFKVADDMIYLDRSIFTRLSLGALKSSAFHVGSTFHDKSDRIVYRPDIGGLFYDADGSGTKYKYMYIATLPKNLDLTISNFMIIA